MNQKRWIWGLIIGIVLIVGLFVVIRGQQTVSPDYELASPNVISISEGVEATFEDLEIGVSFVDNGSAGVSLYAGDVGNTAENFTLNEGDVISYGAYKVELLEAQSREQNAIFQIESNN